MTLNLKPESSAPKPMHLMSDFFAAPSTDEYTSTKIPETLIIAILEFHKPLQPKEARTIISERLLKLPRFRSKISVGEDDQCNFVPMPLESIPMDKMVREVMHVKSLQQQAAFLEEINQQPMGIELPRWRAYLLNSMDDGKNRLCWCVDHCIADGTSLVDILLGILDDYDAGAMQRQSSSRMKVQPRPGCCLGLRAGLRALWNIAVGDQLSDTKHKLSIKSAQLRQARKTMLSSDPIPLSKVKEIQQRFPGSTVNDVVLACLILMLRKYFEKHDQKVLSKSARIRCGIPVNLRGLSPNISTESERNLFQVVPFQCPVHLNDPISVMTYVCKETRIMKASPEPLWRLKVFEFVFKMLPKKKARKALADLGAEVLPKISIVLSSVRGPSKEVRFMGQPVHDMYFYVPGPVGLYLGVFSYKDRIRLGITLDASAEEKEPQRLLAYFMQAVEDMHATALLLPKTSQP